MKQLLKILLLCGVSFGFALTGEEILRKVDKQLNFASAILSMRMEIYLPNQPVRIKRMKSWIKNDNAYVEFLNKEDKNTRYLKLKKQMWVYDGEENNTFLISGHLLKQGMMGSDVSYEDALEADDVYEKYTIQLLGEEKYGEYDCYVVELVAKVKEVAYHRRKMWVDKATFVPVREERYALSGKLLKVQETSSITSVGGRWYGVVTTVSDQLRKNTKTVVVIEEAAFDVPVSDTYFTRRHLER
ncbi:outer membrane lipoprotein-sorting protein [Thermospira aquatica]|uniref:Outer membrane lipoprotein-sorting protein n=1 Tax=Thermospira aquatica TaxID=2828656 RepID=A0AAX3BDD7_9SPIR|nr:outer membrane lipoprotein-sorting protein [Thermospira aquatica]URA09886.1 outer membrane lipoprotein-sorting protein [Thermospira aquatica]